MLGALLAALLVALAGCGVPTVKADCDQLLHDRQFQEVLKDCDSPYDRASAMMGLAGFDLITIYNQITANGNTLTPAGLVTAMGLTPATITAKRRYMEQAVLVVAGAQDNKQAFALLMASGIGMLMSSLEFLDNGLGGGGAVALDGNFTAGESEAAMGISSTGAASSTVTAQPAPYLSGVVAGAPYVFACADIGTPDPKWCDDVPGGSLQVYDDTDTVTGAAYGNGAGFQGPLHAGVDLTPATVASSVFQVTAITLPFALDPATVPKFKAFSGQGNAAQSFAIGIEGYLSHLQAAEVALTQAGSGTQNALSDSIDSIKSQLDNGAVCLATLNPAIPAAFNAIYPIYQSAIGTSARPMPAGLVAANFFQAYNQVASVPGFPAAPAANQFVFGQGLGTVATIGYRFLYATPLATPAVLDLAHATPRIDETPVAFQQAFEAMLLAPAVSAARDGAISYAELLCIGAGTPPTGVKAAAAAGQVTLTWNAIGSATAYTVYRATQPGVTQTSAGATAFPVTVPLPAAPTPPFTDPSAVVGTKYYYVVTSTNASGEGGISREVSATP